MSYTGVFTTARDAACPPCVPHTHQHCRAQAAANHSTYPNAALAEKACQIGKSKMCAAVGGEWYRYKRLITRGVEEMERLRTNMKMTAGALQKDGCLDAFQLPTKYVPDWSRLEEK